MPTALRTAVANYLRSRCPARRTRAEYQTTLRKEWGGGVSIERLGRKEIREFLDWVHERAVAQGDTDAGRTANTPREHLRAVISWALEQDLRESPLRFIAHVIACRPTGYPRRLIAGQRHVSHLKLLQNYQHQLRLFRSLRPIPHFVFGGVARGGPRFRIHDAPENSTWAATRRSIDHEMSSRPTL